MASDHEYHGVDRDDRVRQPVSGNRLYVTAITGNAIMNGAVSRTQVSRLS
jgi:hypothetical protein